MMESKPPDSLRLAWAGFGGQRRHKSESGAHRLPFFPFLLKAESGV